MQSEAAHDPHAASQDSKAVRRLTWILLLLLQADAGAQTVRLLPDLAIAESEYRDAQEAWLKNDPNLERDLFKANPNDIRRRIRRAASLRDDVMVKKEVYLSSLVKRFDDVKTRLLETKDAHLPTDQLKASLNREQTRLLSEQERLELQIRDLPPGDEYALLRRSMEAERNDLVALQNNVALRIRSMDRAGAAQDAAASFADPLEKNLEELGKFWKGERERAVRTRASWARLYQSMEGAIDAKSGPEVKSKTKLAPNASPAAPIPVIVPGSRGMTGAWFYRSQPGAWIGFGEPDSVLLQLHKNGDLVDGIYLAKLPGRGDTRFLSLALQGRLLSDRQARVQWSSQRPPAHGEMMLKLGLDGRLLVQRLNSNDSYIPKGMEVLLPQ